MGYIIGDNETIKRYFLLITYKASFLSNIFYQTKWLFNFFSLRAEEFFFKAEFKNVWLIILFEFVFLWRLSFNRNASSNSNSSNWMFSQLFCSNSCYRSVLFLNIFFLVCPIWLPVFSFFSIIEWTRIGCKNWSWNGFDTTSS